MKAMILAVGGGGAAERPAARRAARQSGRPLLRRRSRSPAPARPSSIRCSSAWAADYHKQTGTSDQLPVDRLGRRHLADQGRHGRLRRDRPAARADGARRGRPRAIPGRDRRHRAGREHRRASRPASSSSPARCSPTSMPARSRNGTTRRSPRSTRASTLPERRHRRRPPLRRLGHHASTSPII